MVSPSSRTGRFSHSFAIHMVRDFFVLLVVVMAVELGVRFALVVHNFNTEEKFATEIAADRLASDVKSVMLNSGGPVAARTLYPILKRNYQEMGLSIAIEPSPATISSIESVFDFAPKGVPAQWQTGEYHEYRVPLYAEKFCLDCHVTANVGDVLGTVTVRNYFASHLLRWWEEVRLTALMGTGKVLLHTVVLFFLLQVRMEPLLSLQSVVALLAKAGADLSHRAKVKSHDEFGELARDLNLFLDRISHIIEDLQTILTKVGAVNQRLSDTSDQMDERLRKLDAEAAELACEAFDSRDRDAHLSKEWVNSVESILAAVQHVSDRSDYDPDLGAKTQKMLAEFRHAVQNVQDIQRRHDRLGGKLINLSQNLHEFSHLTAQIAVFEEKMQGIAEMGQTLVQRLSRTQTQRSS